MITPENNIALLQSKDLESKDLESKDLQSNKQENNKPIMTKPMRSFITVIENVVNELEKHFPEDINLIKELKKLKDRFSYSAPEMNQIYWIKARNLLFERFQDDLVKPLSEIPTNVDIVMRTFSGKNNLII
jgi:hypothetical protein